MKLPAFGRAVVAAREAGLAPTGWLYVERDWSHCTRPWLVIVPADQDPAQFDLTFFAGLAVMLSTTSTARDNPTLLAMIEAANPAVLSVVLDGECTQLLDSKGLVSP